MWGLLRHHRSGSTQTIFFCSSQMTLRRLVSSEFWSHQESGARLWYRHGSLSSSGSSLLEHASSCSSDWPWRCSFDLTSEMWQAQSKFGQNFALFLNTNLETRLQVLLWNRFWSQSLIIRGNWFFSLGMFTQQRGRYTGSTKAWTHNNTSQF